MKKILVPTDFSTEADMAVSAAAQLARKTGASIHFQHVIEPLGGGSNWGFTGYEPSNGEDGLFMIKVMEQAKHQLNTRVNSSELMGIETSGDVVVADLYKGIAQSATDMGADLIVMGSKGADGIDQVLVGSNSERVIRLSGVPVLVIKSKQPVTFANIVFATNADDNSMRSINLVKELQAAFGSTIHLLNVNTPVNFYRTRTMKEMLEKYAQRHSLSNYHVHVYSDTSEEDGIMYFAEEHNADLIVVSTHGRTGLNRLLSGSLAEDLVNHSQRAVLSVKLD
jgi:nucleotide-binding universal stress UspA family protein